MSGIGVIGECVSSQLAFWKRNDLICQANLNGKTMQWGGKAHKRAWSLPVAGVSRAFHLVPCPRNNRAPLKVIVVLKTLLFKPRNNLDE